MQDNTGKVVLVTGASRGIGKAIAVGMAGFGYDVVVTDIEREKAALDKVRAEIAATGRRAFAYTGDVSRKVDVEVLVAAALREAGRIDVLVNNAGILAPSPLQDLSETSWDAHFDVNTKGVWLMCQAVLPGMRARKAGRIVNIASIAGRQGVPTQGHYAATKAAVITLTRVFAQEVGMDGINVNAVCPGIILTEMGRNNLGSEEAVRHWEGVTALRRLGQPEDVVGTVYFLRLRPRRLRHRTGAERRRRHLLSLRGGGPDREGGHAWSRTDRHRRRGTRGLGAARFLAAQGFEPTLFERNATIGGPWDHASASSGIWPEVGDVYLHYPTGDIPAPFGGDKQSGNGREYGEAGLDAFLETKAIIA